MAFKPELRPGQEISNAELQTIFGCSNQGGMRRSLRKNCLVLVSDHTKPFYNDKWKDGTLHYTGMGKYGDQDVNYSQNYTLAHSDTNGVTLYLLEVYTPRVYTYRGEVRLTGEPYRDQQIDSEGRSRQVWIFPLNIVESE